MTFRDILAKFRNISFSERDKGDRFERLMQAFLQTVPWYEGKFQHVWLWKEFPYKNNLGGKDTGIDLVAQTVEGDFWAIQCKCYDEKARIDKPAVDSFLATSSKQFVNDQLQTTSFALRLWISTTNKWGSEAENAIRHQEPPVQRISLADLESAPVDWSVLEKGISGAQARQSKKTPRPHQQAAITAFHEHFQSNDRGKLIMACGTGKTYTSLKIAENQTGGKGLVLFLAPSIALVGQTLREWTAEASSSIFPICICSDPEVSKSKTKADDEHDGYSVTDLAFPASTDVDEIVRQLRLAEKFHTDGLTVVFSTYQSIAVIARAQKEFQREFDLIICDEAHRTTGVTLKDEEESAFVKVHDDAFIHAKKRMYMTATPRLYAETSKKKAQEADAYLCSMDDEAMYGQEVFRIGFGEAVDKNLLADYKVLVLTLSESQIPAAYRWDQLTAKSGIELKKFYKELLAHLGENCTGRVREIYQGSSTNIDEPKNLEKIITTIDGLDWYSAREEGLGNLYEGLLEKNANEKKSGAGQYFTPRVLIDVMTRLMKPQPGERCNDPACGTFGFMIAAHRYVKEHTDDFYDLDADQAKFEREEAFTGCELVHDTHRLALMNAMLHDINGQILLADTLSNQGKALHDFDLVLTNPPFGTKKGGERATRDDFTFPTSNKQLNFLQHIYRSLKTNGKARAAVVLPDNVLFADGDGEKIRCDLMDKCDLHTILRLPTGIFYAQGVKTNVLFFTRGRSDKGNTKEVWFYDLRTNMPSFGKTTPLKTEHFADFEKAYEAEDRHTVQDERWSVFTREQIAEKGNSLDLGLIRDDSVLDYNDLPDPAESAEEAAANLEEAVDLLMSVVKELRALEVQD